MKADLPTNTGNEFSAMYDEYETLSRENAIDISRRKLIRNHVEKYLQPHHKILEINAGSGIDAVYFAEKGYDVLATDISDGSKIHVNDKIQSSGLENLRFQQCSFKTLENIGSETFDHIFSNFGGLNCTDDLPAIFTQFEKLLHPGGFVTLVIMPPYYPWEIATILKGNKNAFRRLQKQGVPAHVGNHFIQTFYHSPKKVKASFPANFKHITTRNLGTFYPSVHFKSLQRYENVISKLVQFDHWINGSSLMIKGIGDYYIITLQKTN